MNPAHEKEGETVRQNSRGRDEEVAIITMRQNSTRRDEEGAFMRQTSGSRSVGDHSSLSMPMETPTDSSAQPSTDYVHYVRGFTDLASAFNWGVIVLTLGSYGLLLSTPVFWLCWSILVTEAVIFYSIRPYWMSIEAKASQTANQAEHSKKPHRPSDQGRAGAVFLKVGMSISLIVMLFYCEDFDQRQNRILLFAGLSIILFEGFPPIFIVKEEFRSLIRNPSGNGTQMIRSIIEGYDSDAADFLTPSVLNAMIGVTGAIVLGGNLGSLMPDKPYWIFVSIFVVDLMAEAIHRFDCGNRSFDLIPETKPSRHYIAVVLRLLVETSLCYWMTKEIAQNLYFPLHVDVNTCDRQCQERSKSLLITMVALGGLQAAATFTTPLCSCVLGPQYGPYIVLFAILLIGYLLFLLIYKFLRGLVSVVPQDNLYMI